MPLDNERSADIDVEQNLRVGEICGQTEKYSCRHFEPVCATGAARRTAAPTALALPRSSLHTTQAERQGNFRIRPADYSRTLPQSSQEPIRRRPDRHIPLATAASAILEIGDHFVSRAMIQALRIEPLAIHRAYSAAMKH